MAKKQDKETTQPIEDGNAALAVQEEPVETALVASDNYGDDGLEEFDQEDIVIPRLVLPQPMSAEGTPGTLRMNLTGDEFETLDVVFLKFHKSRVLWSEDKDVTDPICKSDDNKVPSPSVESPMDTKCEGCTYSLWEKEGKKNSPPPCQETYNFLGVTTDEFFPFWIALRGISIKPTKRFLSSVKIAAKAKGRKLWNAKTTISSLEMRTERGKAFAVKFSGIEWIDDEEINNLRESYAGESIEKTYDAEKQADDATGGENDEVPI